MKKRVFLRIFQTLLIGLLFVSCSNEDVDQEKPTVTVNYANGFPKGCDVLERGKNYQIKAKVSDNLELAAFAIDLHHNFDHHTHDDQVGDCVLDAKRAPNNPLILVDNQSIPSGLTSYEIQYNLSIPENVDLGDYHLAIFVNDITGWQGRTSVDIKIID